MATKGGGAGTVTAQLGRIVRGKGLKLHGKERSEKKRKKKGVCEKRQRRSAAKTVLGEDTLENKKSRYFLKKAPEGGTSRAVKKAGKRKKQDYLIVKVNGFGEDTKKRLTAEPVEHLHPKQLRPKG